ncbi:hypothetical protein [Plantactinospora sp. WMMB782]|uniref:hypothetical protein n=1 Tax=Plantactinospora sp. WMMB782 TaxID=3404121 RepID=UPI003B93622A
MTYTLEVVERLLPAVFDPTMTKGAENPLSPAYRSKCKHCTPGRDACTHRCDLDQWGEGCLLSFEGDEFGVCRHVHNGRRSGGCGFCWCFSGHDRRASVNVKTGNTVVAAMADVRRAWEQAPLLALHRRRLLLRYGLDWSQGEIASKEGVSQQAVAKALKGGLTALADYLNGEAT